MNRFRTIFTWASIASTVVIAAVLVVGCGGDSSRESAGTIPTGLPDSEWGTYSYSHEQTRHVPFTEIDKSNVAELGRVYTVDFQQADQRVPGGQQSQPLMVDGVLYVTTSFNHVFAVDAQKGDVLWHFVPDRIGAFKNFGVTTNRGVAFGEGKVYMLTLDMRIIALDAKTGELAQEVQISDAVQDARPEFGYYESAAPIYYEGKLLIGSSGSDNGVRGFVLAYNADDLSPAWEQPYWTVPPEGQDWRSHGRFHGGGSVWTPVTIDTETDTAYFSVANPSPDFFPQLRPGPNPKTNSVVAVDVNTGQEKWWQQQLPNDSWDYDTAASPVVATARVGGEERKVVSVGTKEGVWFCYDAETGEPIYQRVQFLDKIDHPKLKPGQPIEIYPSAIGGQNSAPAAYNPQTNMHYIAATQSGAVIVQAESAAQINKNRVRGDVDSGAINGFGEPVPGFKDYGLVTAIDMDTGKIAWKAKTPTHERGGVTTTASGLIFVGSSDGVLRAFDAESGDLLWRFQTGAQIASAPTIYELDGKEYVALTTGGTFSSANGGKTSKLEVFALGGDTTQSPAPQVTAPETPAPAQPSGQPQYLKLGDGPRTLELTLVASQGPAFGGMNFNGYGRGEMVVRVPLGYTVDVNFRNQSAQVPHSAMVTAIGQVDRTQGFAPAFPGAQTENPQFGITSGTQFFSFAANKAGRYALLCAIPGHAVSGMWNTLEIVPAGQAPSITLGDKTTTLER
jgi:alcohol dehydrogenase (cytochrome c)